MRQIILATLVLALSLSRPAAQDRSADHVLDVAGAPTTAESASTTSAGDLWAKRRAVSRRATPRAITLTVNLLSLDRDNYDTGDPFLFEVIVQNVGRQPIAIPWSPDVVGFYARSVDSPAVRRGSLFLEVRRAGEVRRIGWLEPQLLIGAPNVPNSLIELLPGKKALMRARGYWRVGETQLAEILAASRENGTVNVHAVLALDDEGTLVTSADSKRVSIRPLLR